MPSKKTGPQELLPTTKPMLIWTRTGKAVLGNGYLKGDRYFLTVASLAVFSDIATFIRTGLPEAYHYLGNVEVMLSGVDLVFDWKHALFGPMVIPEQKPVPSENV